MSLIVEEWPITRLVEYARNPRKNDPHVERMAGMIREFGFRIPIVAKSDGTVVDGHLRLKAARHMGLEAVPVALADGLSDAQIKAFRLLANKSVAWSEWDNDLLRIEMEELRFEGFDLSLTGFDEIAVGQLFAEESSPATEWKGMPEFDQKDKTAYKTVSIHFKDQDAVDEFAKLIGQNITEKTRSTWFPEVEIETYVDKRYTADESSIPDLHSIEGAVRQQDNEPAP